MRLKHAVLALGFGAMSLTPPAASAQSWFSSRSAWNAAVSGVVDRDFESLAQGAYVHGLVDNSVMFTGQPNNYLFTFGPSNGYNSGTGTFLYGGFYGGSNIAATMLSPGMLAMGFDYAAFNSLGPPIQGGNISVQTSSGVFTQALSPMHVIQSQGGQQFIGFLSTSDILSVTYWVNGPIDPTMDNFSTATALVSATPEPASMALFATGLFATAFVRRRKVAK